MVLLASLFLFWGTEAFPLSLWFTTMLSFPRFIHLGFNLSFSSVISFQVLNCHFFSSQPVHSPFFPIRTAQSSHRPLKWREKPQGATNVHSEDQSKGNFTGGTLCFDDQSENDSGLPKVFSRHREFWRELRDIVPENSKDGAIKHEKFWTWPSNVLLQPKKPAISWAAPKEMQPAGQEKGF